MPKGYTYILECSDGTFYTGSTVDLEKRFVEHQEGRGANHTKKHLPVKLVYFEEFQRIEDAFYREKQIQGWSRSKKTALIENNFDDLVKFSECKNDSNSKLWLTSITLSDRDAKKQRDLPTRNNPLEAENNPLKNEHNSLVAKNNPSESDRSCLVAERSRNYSNGKLLLTAEYAVLDGAKALAIPTKYGQDLTAQAICEKVLHWKSYDAKNHCWLETQLESDTLKIISATFDATTDGGDDTLVETLQKILLEAQKLNPKFLKENAQFLVETHLGFPKNWGLGSSSTLINNIANWANVNAFTLLQNSFGGSGYDIACAQHNTPILYQLKDKKPIVETVAYNPTFKEQLYFVHLNKKQQSKEAIKHYKAQKNTIDLKEISMLTEAFVVANTIQDLEKIMQEHEKVISSLIAIKPIQKRLFSDYFGSIKSLGAWGGDFILATGNKDTKSYFAKKGYSTIIPFKEMIL